MKQPLLVGLNDAVNNDYLIGGLRDKCLTTMSVQDTPLSYKNLFAGENATKEQVNNTASIWANIFEFSKNNGIQEKFGKFELDLDSYIYTRYQANPIFTDDYGNRIFVIYERNKKHIELLSSGMFGFSFDSYDKFKEYRNNKGKNKNNGYYELSECYTTTIGNEFNGDGYAERMVASYTMQREYNIVYGGRGNNDFGIEKLGIGQRKLDKPVIVFISRDRGLTKEDWGKFLPFVSAIVSIIPGIGPELALLINSAVSVSSNYITNPNYKLTGDDISKIGTVLSPVMYSVGGQDLTNYLRDGINLYEAYNSGNYQYLAQELGISNVMSKKFNEQIFDPNYTKTIQLSSKNPIDFDKTNAIVQMFRNQSSYNGFLNAGFNFHTPQYSDMLSQVSSSNSLTTSNEILNLMTMYSGGGYTSVLPTKVDNKEILSYLFNKLNNTEQTPEIHKAFIDMKFGIPTGVNAFDELLLLNIENQIVRGKLKTYTLPAQLPPAKAVCIKNYLERYGIEVFGANYTNTTPPIPINTLSNVKNNKKYIRNFK